MLLLPTAIMRPTMPASSSVAASSAGNSSSQSRIWNAPGSLPNLRALSQPSPRCRTAARLGAAAVEVGERRSAWAEAYGTVAAVISATRTQGGNLTDYGRRIRRGRPRLVPRSGRRGPIDRRDVWVSTSSTSCTGSTSALIAAIRAAIRARSAADFPLTSRQCYSRTLTCCGSVAAIVVVVCTDTCPADSSAERLNR